MRRLRIIARAARGRRNGGRRLRLAIAEIDQRRDRIRDRTRRAIVVQRARQLDHRRIDISKSRSLVLEFGDDALGDLRPDAGRARHRSLVTQRDGIGEIGRRQSGKYRECHFRADALHALQQAKPFALHVGAETEQLDLIFPHISLDGQHRRLARLRQRLQRPRRAMHLIADALHVEDHVILAVGVDQTFQFSNHDYACRVAMAAAAPAMTPPLMRFSSFMARELRNSLRARAAANA